MRGRKLMIMRLRIKLGTKQKNKIRSKYNNQQSFVLYPSSIYISPVYSCKPSRGACVDNEAGYSVRWLEQNLAYLKLNTWRMRLKFSDAPCLFGNEVHLSSGIIEVRFWSVDGGYIPLYADAMRAGCIFLLGAQRFEKERTMVELRWKCRQARTRWDQTDAPYQYPI